MVGIANAIMRRQINAILICGLLSMLPLLGWLAAAGVALVTLRQGAKEGFIVLLVSLIGASLSQAFLSVSPSTPIGLILMYIAAVCLRETRNWQWSLIIIAAGVAASYPLLFSAAESTHSLFQQQYEHMFGNRNLTAAQQEQLKALYSPQGITQMFALSTVYLSTAAFCLARWWQAKLFNPGGFGEEFRAIRFSPVVAISMLVIAGAAYYFKQPLWAGIALFPLMIAGIALAHALIKARKLDSFWLVFFYVILFTAGTSLAIFACFDSFFNFRQRWNNHHPS